MESCSQPQANLENSRLVRKSPSVLLRELVIQYLDGVCNYCGSKDKLDLHHSIPLYAGGTNTMGNLEVVCRDCHRKLHIQARRIYPFIGEYSDRAEKRDISKIIEPTLQREMLRYGLTKKEIEMVAKLATR